METFKNAIQCPVCREYIKSDDRIREPLIEHIKSHDCLQVNVKFVEYYMEALDYSISEFSEK